MWTIAAWIDIDDITRWEDDSGRDIEGYRDVVTFLLPISIDVKITEWRITLQYVRTISTYIIANVMSIANSRG